jgi:hypothetical protein
VFSYYDFNYGLRLGRYIGLRHFSPEEQKAVCRLLALWGLTPETLHLAHPAFIEWPRKWKDPAISLRYQLRRLHNNHERRTVVLRNRQVVAGFLSLRSRFYPGLVKVEFIVKNLAMGDIFLSVLRVSPVSFLPLLHIHLYLICTLTRTTGRNLWTWGGRGGGV